MSSSVPSLEIILLTCYVQMDPIKNGEENILVMMDVFF